jgi:ligand-binding sensor domain-containing protein
MPSTASTSSRSAASNRVQSVAVVGDLDEIWVAGADGVTVSAGADSTFYNAENSPLESNRLGAIAVDPEGVVWLGGDGALYRVAGESWTVYNAESVGDAGFPVRLITGLAPTSDGALWLGDIDGALCRFDPATERCTAAFRAEAGMATAPLTSLTLDAGDQLYFTTAGEGFSVYDGAAWQQFARPNEGLRGNAVQAATVDPDSALWVVTEAGIQQVVGANRPPPRSLDAPIDPATIQTIYTARNGDLWIGGAGAGVWDGSAWRVYTTTAGLAGATVRAISEDSRGRIWLGADAGISIWNGESFFNLTLDTGLPSADIRALLADGDAMWIGSAGGGLYRFVGNQLEVRNTDNTNLPSDVITALGLTADGALLVGSDAGLVELRDGAITPVTALGERSVTELLVHDASIWVGAGEEGLFYDVGTGWQQETTAGALPANRVTALAAGDDAVWVGGATGGLVRYELPPKEEN